MNRITEAVKHLIIINVLFFIAANLYPDLMYGKFALYFPENSSFEWWQVLTHMFMHGGLMHIVFNMYALWAFGSPLEQMWGKKKFLFFYFSAGLGAALIHTGVNYYYVLEGYQGLSGLIDKSLYYELLRIDSQVGQYLSWERFYEQAVPIMEARGLNPELLLQANPQDVLASQNALMSSAVGASGAIYGILVAFGMSFPNAELMLIFLPIPIKAKYFIPALIALDLFSGVTGYSIFGGGIAHFAHVGGALFGFIMMWFWKRNQFNQNRWDR